jgi:HD superfamily phosphodiesterase
MLKYNPEIQPNPEQWLAFDEQERIQLAEDFHVDERIKVPNLSAHAIFHAIVENQIAEGFEPTTATMARLVKQGLTRHDAIHAIGSVLAEYLFELAAGAENDDKAQAKLVKALDKISAKAWGGR